jgi:hypothetical protein
MAVLESCNRMRLPNIGGCGQETASADPRGIVILLALDGDDRVPLSDLRRPPAFEAVPNCTALFLCPCFGCEIQIRFAKKQPVIVIRCLTVCGLSGDFRSGAGKAFRGIV